MAAAKKNLVSMPAAPATQRVSEVLKTFSETTQKPYSTVGDLKNALSDRVFGILMIFFALPNLVPVPIPGISAFLGTALLFLCFQLLLGRKAPWFPGWIEKRSFSKKTFNTILTHALPYILRLESLLKPRLIWIFTPVAERFLALICLILALLIALPIPFANWLPAFSLFLIALALLEHDGIFALVGLISAFFSLIWVSSLLTAFFWTVFLFIKDFFF